MNKMLKITFIGVVAVLISGCASHEKFALKYDSWLGKNISQLINQIGYPDRTFSLPNKNKVYVYERSRMYSIPSFPMMGYGGGYGAYAMFGYGGSELIQETCKLFIEANKKGNILKWASRGNHCVSN